MIGVVLQILTVLVVVALFDAAAISLVNEFFIAFSATTGLAMIFGIAVVCCRRKGLVVLFTLLEFGFISLYMYLFQWLGFEGRLANAESSITTDLHLIVQLLVGLGLGRILFFLLQLVIMCFRLQPSSNDQTSSE